MQQDTQRIFCADARLPSWGLPRSHCLMTLGAFGARNAKSAHQKRLKFAPKDLMTMAGPSGGRWKLLALNVDDYYIL